jgi:xanthine dehydrogenase accessory factor
MQLLTDILARIDRGERLALCVVVESRGSTPQKRGATMLVAETGQTVGTLGGGCVEAEARVRALRLLQANANGLLEFKLTTDYGWDDGLACGGTMRVAVVTIASTAFGSSKPGVHTPGPEGSGAPDANTNDAAAGARGIHPGLCIAHQLRLASDEVHAGRSASISLVVPDEAGVTHTFTHEFHPAPTLLIAGAGHIAGALASIAPSLDFDVVVIDDRVDHLTESRFPRARRVVGDIERELRAFPITPQTHVVIVTRGHQHDAAALSAVVESPARYVGLIGSKRKVHVILQSLRERGVAEEHLDRVHTPIGLDLGAITPGEIAVSIAAELVAVRRGKSTDTVKSMRWRA